MSLRIVALGTSLTATSLWTEELRRRVERGINHEVHLCVIARSGATSRWGLAQASRLSSTRPDVLTIEFAANDANVRHLLPVSESSRNHVSLIDIARHVLPAVKIFLLAVSPTWGARGFWIRPRLSRYHRLYASLAQADGISFVDCRAAWNVSTIRATVPDGLHPTPDGMTRIVAPAVASAICEALR